jgi:protein-S-isoprenylcysteine O-methyltransferase Ste14
MPLKYFLPVYFLAYVLVAFLWRSYVVWKKTSINPIVFRHSDNAHDFIGRVFKFLFALITAEIVLYSFFPVAYPYTAPIEFLQSRWTRALGVTLLLLSLGWTMIAQAQMGLSWRVGIDQEHRTPLIEAGVFRISRNPIFLGMMVTLLGLFLVIPNALSLLAFVLGVVLIGIQVRLEEEHLTKQHGEGYAVYRRKVRRWL